MEPVALPQPPRWAVWSSGFLLVAGILHLTALPAHAGQARGLGLFFLGLGAAQVVWACLTLFRSTQLGARIGLALLAVAPVMLWVLTRTLRAPWSTVPEPVDIVSLGTVLLELAAAVAMFVGRAGVSAADSGTPALARRTLVVFVVIGIAFGAVGYGGAMVAEVAVPWLGEPEASHHGEGEAAEGDAAPDGAEQHPHSD